jgi:ankyrin repeat protein
VGRLVEAGASLNALDKDGKSPIFAAVADGNFRITELLIQSGAKTTIVGKDGQDLLIKGVTSNSPQILELILPSGRLNIDDAGKLGRTALF